MDPIVAAAIVAAIGSFATAIVARRSTQRQERAKAEAEETSNELAGVKIQLDAWPALYRVVVEELEREREARRHDVAEERAIAEAFAAKADRLEQERDGALDALRDCREHLTNGKGNHEQGT